ncbi:MAG: transglycosylase SLT domain-containing protein [Draconibacterium sp.]|nr:transglycosylase SLT domain-containing protein [Draconibacterium sp.]
MANKIFGLLITSLLFTIQYVNSQNAYTVLTFESDSTFVVISDTIVETNTREFYERYNETPDIDDNVNIVISEQMDNLSNSLQSKNSFRLDSSEVKTSEWYPKNLPDSVYIQRLMDAEQELNLSYNKVVNNYIKMYSERRRNQVEIMLGLSEYYFPIFEETLDKYNMPLELKYLPIIESALNPVARSRVGASGLWQFMYATGKSLDLEITTFVDERRDPVKSSDAAARYLKKLYDTYDDWHLAIAAYNCGPGNVNRAIRRSGGKRNYWDIYYRLPRETRGYVPAFIAALYAMEYHKEHNLEPRFPEIPLETDTVIINKYLHFEQIASTLNIEIEQIRALNPMYRRDIIPAKASKSYPLVLPQEKTIDFIDKDTTVFAFEREKYFPNNTLKDPTDNSSSNFIPVDVKGKAKVIYTVKSGDNVGFISSWFKVRSSDLKYWNNINRDLIRAGQKLAIYVAEKDKAKYAKVNTMSFSQKQAMIGKSTTPKEKTVSKPLDSNYVYYKVRKGDTLWEISQKYAGISSNEIMQLNKLKNENSLYIGQQLKIKKKS